MLTSHIKDKAAEDRPAVRVLKESDATKYLDISAAAEDRPEVRVLKVTNLSSIDQQQN